MESETDRQSIQKLGNVIGPESIKGVYDIYEDQQQSLAAAIPPRRSEVAYGPDERHRLDVYSPDRSPVPCPVLVWVHGGGFTRGDKGGGGVWQNANVGRMAAQEGMLGVVMNYRLAPQNRWPAGSEDLALVVDWVKREAASIGGDPTRVFLAGSSAGAAHVAGYLKLRHEAQDIAGAIMLSGLYGFTPLNDERDISYFGDDAAAHASMVPLDAVVDTSTPLFVACAEFDPPRFQEEFVGLLRRRLEIHGSIPRSYIASGHNHFSLAYHLGGGDRRLADEIASFVQSPLRG